MCRLAELSVDTRQNSGALRVSLAGEGRDMRESDSGYRWYLNEYEILRYVR